MKEISLKKTIYKIIQKINHTKRQKIIKNDKSNDLVYHYIYYNPRFCIICIICIILIRNFIENQFHKKTYSSDSSSYTSILFEFPYINGFCSMFTLKYSRFSRCYVSTLVINGSKILYIFQLNYYSRYA